MKIKLKESQLKEAIQNAIMEVFGNSREPSAFGYMVLSEGKGAYNGSRYLSRAISFDEGRMIYSSLPINEKVSFEPSKDKRGGIIVFSTDVNAVGLSTNKLINYIKQKLATISNRINATRKVDKVAAANKLEGWTIGHYLDGRYTAKNNKQYGENSLSVELNGVDFDTLVKIAEELCIAFKQESVLLKDFSSGRVLFVEPD